MIEGTNRAESEPGEAKSGETGHEDRRPETGDRRQETGGGKNEL